jgi:hypothetical protein
VRGAERDHAAHAPPAVERLQEIGGDEAAERVADDVHVGEAGLGGVALDLGQHARGALAHVAEMDGQAPAERHADHGPAELSAEIPRERRGDGARGSEAVQQDHRRQRAGAAVRRGVAVQERAHDQREAGGQPALRHRSFLLGATDATPPAGVTR